MCQNILSLTISRENQSCRVSVLLLSSIDVRLSRMSEFFLHKLTADDKADCAWRTSSGKSFNLSSGASETRRIAAKDNCREWGPSKFSPPLTTTVFSNDLCTLTPKWQHKNQCLLTLGSSRSRCWGLRWCRILFQVDRLPHHVDRISDSLVCILGHPQVDRSSARMAGHLIDRTRTSNWHIKCNVISSKADYYLMTTQHLTVIIISLDLCLERELLTLLSTFESAASIALLRYLNKRVLDPWSPCMTASWSFGKCFITIAAANSGFKLANSLMNDKAASST